MIEAQQNILREFLHHSYMLSECLDKTIFVKNITKFAENITAGKHIIFLKLSMMVFICGIAQGK
jgi:hypothetical protein